MFTLRMLLVAGLVLSMSSLSTAADKGSRRKTTQSSGLSNPMKPIDKSLPTQAPSTVHTLTQQPRTANGVMMSLEKASVEFRARQLGK